MAHGDGGMQAALDDIDRDGASRGLQEDGRISTRSCGADRGLSRAATHARVRRLGPPGRSAATRR